MRSRVVEVRTGAQEQVVDLTDRCAAFVGEVAADEDGLLHVFLPHATAGLAIIETGSGSDDDLLALLAGVLPEQGPARAGGRTARSGDGWRHGHGTPGHGRDHVLPAFVAPYASLPVLQGDLALGTWQRICLVDTNVDNPQRKVRLSFLGG